MTGDSAMIFRDLARVSVLASASWSQQYMYFSSVILGVDWRHGDWTAVVTVMMLDVVASDTAQDAGAPL